MLSALFGYNKIFPGPIFNGNSLLSDPFRCEQSNMLANFHYFTPVERYPDVDFGPYNNAYHTGICTIEETLGYVWSLPVNVAVVGMETPALVRHNARLARDFEPMSPADLQALRDRIEPAADLALEWYKT